MKKISTALAFFFFGSSAFAVVVSVGVTCTPPPSHPDAPTYKIFQTSGGAPGFPVSRMDVTKEQPGYAAVSASLDLLKAGYSPTIGPVQDGSALLYTFVTGTYDPATHKSVNQGYVSVYERDRVSYLLIDIQLPANVPNAAEVNTTPPLTGYTCVKSVH